MKTFTLHLKNYYTNVDLDESINASVTMETYEELVAMIKGFLKGKGIIK